MSEVLKPIGCPGCGDIDEIMVRLVNSARRECVMCEVCGWQGPGQATHEAAIAAWNTRPTHDALVTALKRIREHTDPEPASENYRADDREGCFDTVFSIATDALKAAGEL